jgi:hypothetical protein
LLALLANDNAPEAAPLLCGVNTTFNETLCPAEIVNGNEAPDNVNNPLLLTADEIVTLAPLALSVAGRVADCPTVTLPKLNADGLKDNCPITGAVSPVPESGTFSAGPTMKMRPPLVPDTCGV